MRGLSTEEAGAIERCAGSPMLDQVRSWSDVNSGSRNLAGLDTVAGLLADAYSKLPGQIHLVEPARVEVMTPEGDLAELQHGRHLRLQVRPEAPLQLLFTGHMDTVYPADHPFQKVFWQDEGVLGGPGVADMKGGLAVLLSALEAVEASPYAERFGYEVLINSDEEVGSAASAELINKAATGKRAAFTYEPSALPDGTLAGARPGSGNFSIALLGRSAHAGRNPQDGRNALVAAADLALRLSEAARPGLSINPARIDGGGPNNVVPDKAVLRVNLRPATPDDQASAHALIEQMVAEVCARHELKAQVHGGFGRPPKPLSPASEKLFELVRSCGSDLGQAIKWQPSGGVCDGNNIAACGVPVVDTMGVRGGAIHSNQEYLIVDSLVERAQLSALAIIRLVQEAGE